MWSAKGKGKTERNADAAVCSDHLSTCEDDSDDDGGYIGDDDGYVNGDPDHLSICEDLPNWDSAPKS